MANARHACLDMYLIYLKERRRKSKRKKEGIRRERRKREEGRGRKKGRKRDGERKREIEGKGKREVVVEGQNILSYSVCPFTCWC